MINALEAIAIGILASAGLSATGQSSGSSAPTYDIVIRNGRILDGAGNPWIAADVAISHGRFVRVGNVEGKGKREIDATGLYVSPGWIDVMDQSAEALLKDGLAENKVREGVTTAISGENGIPTGPSHVGDFFSQLQRQGISLNFGCYYSESQARVAVIGENDRPPTPDELDKMKQLVASAMQEGAMGITTALIYPPSSFAHTDELIATAGVAGVYGGFYASHIRGEGKEVVQAVDELIEISEKAHLPAEIYHMKVTYEPGWGKLIETVGQHVDAARQRGVEVAGDLYVYDAAGTTLAVTIPPWASDGGDVALKTRLRDPAMRERLKTEPPGWWKTVAAGSGWDRIVLGDTGGSPYTKYEGRSISDIATALSRDPVDTVLDIVGQSDAPVRGIFHVMSEKDIETALKFPWTSIGDDAGATVAGEQAGHLDHPRAYGNFPRVIARYVREEHTLSLEDAIRKMTSWPAMRLRLSGRGVIREGMWADVTIFDYDKIQDLATYEHPAIFPVGIPYVLVNGVVVVDNSRHTGQKPGAVLFGQGKGLRLPMP